MIRTIREKSESLKISSRVKVFRSFAMHSGNWEREMIHESFETYFGRVSPCVRVQDHSAEYRAC